MADEAILKVRLEEPFDFDVSGTTGIEKGTVCKMLDPRVCIASSGNGDVPAGIAHREKIGSDGRSRLACFRNGVFLMETVTEAGAEGTIVTGDQVCISGVNLIRACLTDGTEDHLALGRALETVFIEGEPIQVMVRF